MRRFFFFLSFSSLPLSRVEVLAAAIGKAGIVAQRQLGSVERERESYQRRRSNSGRGALSSKGSRKGARDGASPQCGVSAGSEGRHITARGSWSECCGVGEGGGGGRGVEALQVADVKSIDGGITFGKEAAPLTQCPCRPGGRSYDFLMEYPPSCVSYARNSSSSEAMLFSVIRRRQQVTRKPHRKSNGPFPSFPSVWFCLEHFARRLRSICIVPSLDAGEVSSENIALFVFKLTDSLSLCARWPTESWIRDGPLFDFLFICVSFWCSFVGKAIYILRKV